MKVAVVDVGLSNLGSVRRAVEECGGSSAPMVQPSIDRAEWSHVLLPGVGAFADGMDRLGQSGWVEALHGAASEGIPILGICLGMHLLADWGDEGGGSSGLGLIAGEVRRIESSDVRTRIPHIGWNEVKRVRESALLKDIADETDFYFVHSFVFHAKDNATVVATTPYAEGVSSVVADGVTFGTQFHPEKSSKAGLRLLNNFLSLPRGG